MQKDKIILNHRRYPIEVILDIDQEKRVIKLITPSDQSAFKMDDDPYPLKGPLYYFIKKICDNNKFQMAKIFYKINIYNGLWDRHILF